MSNNVQAGFLALASTFLYAVFAAMAKEMSAEYHVLQILLFRQLAVLISSLPSIARNFPGALYTKHPGLHVLRLSSAFVALSSSILAVSMLPLTTATTLSFAQAFFVTLLAMYFLKEQVGRHRIAAVIIGFIGVLIVVRPSLEGFQNPYMIVPLIGAVAAAIAGTLVRKLSQTESTATLLVYQALFVGMFAAIPMVWLWKTPDLWGWMMLCAMGAIAAMGQWIGVHALRVGEASVVSVVRYVQLVYAALLGYLIFAEVPDRYTILGAAVIVGSSAYMLHRERVRKKLAAGA